MGFLKHLILKVQSMSIDIPVIIDSPRSSQHGPAVASFSVGATTGAA